MPVLPEKRQECVLGVVVLVGEVAVRCLWGPELRTQVRSSQGHTNDCRRKRARVLGDITE